MVIGYVVTDEKIGLHSSDSFGRDGGDWGRAELLVIRYWLFVVWRMQ